MLIVRKPVRLRERGKKYSQVLLLLDVINCSPPGSQKGDRSILNSPETVRREEPKKDETPNETMSVSSLKVFP